MRSNSNKIFIILFLLIFSGQVTASASNSCMGKIENQPAMSNHSGHMMNTPVEDTGLSSSDECCDENTDCPMSGCISFSLPDIIFDSETIVSSQNIIAPLTLAPNQTSTYLYRPPILS